MYEGVRSGRGMYEGVGSGRGMHEGVGSGRARTMYQGWEWVFVGALGDGGEGWACMRI